MNITPSIACILILAAFADAKISGGPRGRFDKHLNYTNYHVSARHAHYSYHPPSKIYFLCRHCSNFAAYPVFHGLPPTYVYKYREFGGRFSELLTGLALYNLGRAAADHWEYSRYYPMRPDEKCSMQVVDRKHIEEVKVPCFVLSTFVERSPESFLPDPNALDISSPQIDIRPFLPHDSTTLKVTRDMDCLLWHNNTLDKHRYTLPCALLMQYSDTMKPSGIPVYVWLPSTLALVITIYLLCYCFCKRRVRKEALPINSGLIQPRDYCTNN